MDLFTQKGYFPTPYFTTVIENAAYYKDYKWAEQFIQKNLAAIDPLHIKFIENYCNALLDFSLGKFNKVIANLAKLSPDNPRTKMQINILALKAFYETSDYEQAIMLVDSSKHFLKNSVQIPEDRKKFYMNFI